MPKIHESNLEPYKDPINTYMKLLILLMACILIVLISLFVQGMV